MLQDGTRESSEGQGAGDKHSNGANVTEYMCGHQAGARLIAHGKECKSTVVCEAKKGFAYSGGDRYQGLGAMTAWRQTANMGAMCSLWDEW